MKTIFRFLVSEIWSILYLYTWKTYQNKWPKMTIIFATKYAQFSEIGSVPTKDMQTPPSEMVRFIWEMWNVLNRMKDEIIFVCDFYFYSIHNPNPISTSMTILFIIFSKGCPIVPTFFLWDSHVIFLSHLKKQNIFLHFLNFLLCNYLFLRHDFFPTVIQINAIFA